MVRCANFVVQNQTDTENQTESETWVATGLDANMPTYRMLLILVGYIFVPSTDRVASNNSSLHRPHISSLRALLIVILHICVSLLVGFLCVILMGLESNFIYLTGISGAYFLILAMICRARIIIWLVCLYQARAPAEIREKCVMTPCCSNYMILAIEKYGLFTGVSKSVERLRRCGQPARDDYP